MSSRQGKFAGSHKGGITLRKLLFISLLIILIGGVVLVGCSQKASTTITSTTSTAKTTSSGTTSVAAPTKVLKIGSVQNLTNAMGLEQKKWLDLFAKLINAQGGWKIGSDTYTVDMIVYDSQGDAAKAKNYLERLVLQDGVKYILGSPTGDPAVDTTVTEPNKVIDLGVDVTGTSTDPSIQYYWTPNGMFFGRGLMYDMYKDLSIKGYKTYVSAKTDDVMGHATDGMCNATWQVAAPNIKYLGTVFYDATTTDFSPIATKIKSMNPDILDCNYAGATQLFNALYDQGFKGLILPAQVYPDMFEAVLTHCGKDFMEGWQYFLQDPRMYPNQPAEVMDLLDAYTKEYGDFQTGGCMWVAYWFILKDALDNTQSIDVDVVKKYLDNSNHPVRTLTGYCQLFARPDANNLRTISGEPADFVGTIKDGKEIPVQGIAIKDHYLASILSYNLVDVYKAYWDKYGYPTFPPDQKSVIKFSDLGITGHD
jgi:ABC-type branched-subunit amino acid transport system substrate-binding protein